MHCYQSAHKEIVEKKSITIKRIQLHIIPTEPMSKYCKPKKRNSKIKVMQQPNKEYSPEIKLFFPHYKSYCYFWQNSEPHFGISSTSLEIPRALSN